MRGSEVAGLVVLALLLMQGHASAQSAQERPPQLTSHDLYLLSCEHQDKIKHPPDCKLTFGPLPGLAVPQQTLSGNEHIPCDYCKLRAARLASLGDVWYFDMDKRAWMEVKRKPECVQVPAVWGCFPDVWR
jgi:hypothetical protein